MPIDPNKRGKPQDRSRQQQEGEERDRELQQEDREEGSHKQPDENRQKQPQDKTRRDHPPGNPHFQ